MRTLVNNILPAKGAIDIGGKLNAIRRIEKYLKDVKKEIIKTVSNRACIEKLVEILKTARGLDKEVMLFGMNLDCHTLSHACADFLKISHLKVVPVSMPELTAFGNDYSYPYNLKELLRRRRFGSGNILVGIQLGGKSHLLDEAFSYNRINNGLNVLITNSTIKESDAHLLIPVSTQNTAVAGDVVQMILHYCSASLALENSPALHGWSSESLQDYCGLLLESLSGEGYSCKTLAEISVSLKEKTADGNAVFTFGNGGSAAIASYFTDGLRTALSGPGKARRNIIDLTSFANHITACMHDDCYQSSVFTQMLQNLGVEEGDVLLGISSSGNSENIYHPFTHIPEAVRIGILGFHYGGKIGKSAARDIAFIVPDAGGFKSYQRAEDGQRIAVSSILSTLGRMG